MSTTRPLTYSPYSRHADALAAFRDADHHSNAFGVTLDPAAYGPNAHRVMSLLGMDPPQHTRMRSITGKSFTPRGVAAGGGAVKYCPTHALRIEED